MKIVITKKLLISMVVITLIIGTTFIAYKKHRQIQTEIDLQKSEIVLTEPKKEESTSDMGQILNDSPQESKINQEPVLPNSAIVEMLFLVQAPFANWDPAHEEACEEASILMVSHYLDKTGIKNQDQGEKEILDLVSFETEKGYGPSVTLEELAKIAETKLGLKNSRIVKEASKENIKEEIANGKPVIIPAAGKILPNPNFRNGGPNYHMLVVKGYNSEYFITNDPGTKKGEGFKYKFDDLLNAIHNWNPNNILNGEKAYLVFD